MFPLIFQQFIQFRQRKQKKNMYELPNSVYFFPFFQGYFYYTFKIERP